MPTVAVLFDGAGLARLGLEQAGFECVGFELDPIKIELGEHVGSGQVNFCDATKVDLSKFDIIWASPPCQWLSQARTMGDPKSCYSDNLLTWSLQLRSRWLWVENTVLPRATWGSIFNAAQFTPSPLQNRSRMIGGRYITPSVYRPYKRKYPEAVSTILASEYKFSKNDARRGGRSFGRLLSVEECALYQGFEIPKGWYQFTKAQMYEAIGNAVPVYMARAFGEALYENLNLS